MTCATLDTRAPPLSSMLSTAIFWASATQVTYVRNFTDIDDKIIRRAAEEGTDYRTIADRYIKAFYEDMDSLGLLRPTIEPLATEHIPADDRNRAQARGEGRRRQGRDRCLFQGGPTSTAMESCPAARRTHMLAGARVEVDENKTNPLDFVLWKGSKPGEPSWDSPWGPGRPGWHIECSAMANKYLGFNIDLHGGAKDLVFPHHENEIAQSEMAFGEPFVRYWIHNGFVNINNEKMSKSLGNFFTIRDVLKDVHSESLRLFVISKHYRSPVDFSDETVAEAERGLERLYSTLEAVCERMGPAFFPLAIPAKS